MSGELLIELLAKSGVVAGAGLLLSVLLRRRPAAEQVDVLRAAVCVLLALPAILAFGPDLRVEVLPAMVAGPAAEPAAVWHGTVTPLEGLSVTSSLRPPSLAEGLIGVWIIGAALVFGRFALGVWTLWRWTRTGAPVTDRAWTAPLERLESRRPPRLLAAGAVEAPLSWGLPPGVILIGRSCLARPENADAVLAHELAHVRRGDWLFLALSRLALALFWFNPLVWMLHATLASRTASSATGRGRQARSVRSPPDRRQSRARRGAPSATADGWSWTAIRRPQASQSRSRPARAGRRSRSAPPAAPAAAGRARRSPRPIGPKGEKPG